MLLVGLATYPHRMRITARRWSSRHHHSQKTGSAASAAIGVAVLLLVTSCSGIPQSQLTSSASPSPAPSTTAAAAPPDVAALGIFAPAEPTGSVPCLDDGFEFLAIPGEDRSGAITIGEGTVGIVLGHQSDGRVCQWADEAVQLADLGYTVILPALNVTEQLPTFLAAEQWLRAEGATDVVLAGASMGGTLAIASAGAVDEPPLAVIAISAPASFNGTDALAFAPQITSPVLLLAGSRDRDFGQQAAELEAALAGETDLQVLDSGAHGVRLLEEPAAHAAFDAFLAEHTPPR